MRDKIMEILIMVFMFVLGLSLGAQTNRDQAIEHGVAQHNPQTGEFEWLK